MAKILIHKNNKIEKEDGDIEQDMKTLGQVRDILLGEFKIATDMVTKLSIANSITSVVQARENAEMFLLRVMGAFDNHRDEDDEYCEGCPECDAEMKKPDPNKAN